MYYHIVGINGAGMSAIANILLDQGQTVSGSDLQSGPLTAALAARGATVMLGHAAANVAGADAVVTTSAARPDHVELAAARARGIPLLKRADLWHEWSRQRPVVAVAGTAGKTTTSALIALLLDAAGRAPGFVVGGEIPDLGVNARWGDAKAPLVIEADEYDRAFLALAPQIAVVTNVEWDHVDIYPTAATYAAAFAQFAASVPHESQLVVCGDDAGATALAGPLAVQYGVNETIVSDPASCRLAPLDYSAAGVRDDGERTHFDVWRYDRQTFGTRLWGQFAMRLPGEHNVRNALAAIAVAAMLGVDAATIRRALLGYGGTLRRFELRGERGGVTVIDDYAHHPAKVRATLAAARQRYPGRRLVVYFQPHTYSRSAALAAEWATAFGDADALLVGEIYAARETETLGMDAAALARIIDHPDARPTGDVQRAAAELVPLLRPGDVLLTLGAGDSTLVGGLVLDALGRSR